jgi:hypothetical protein
LGATALFLSGCVQSEDVVMKNPQTGKVHECKTDSGLSLFPIAQTMAEAFVRTFQCDYVRASPPIPRVASPHDLFKIVR